MTTIPVAKKPTVTIIPTGNELVSADAALSSGRIIEFNGTVFANFIKEWGGEPILHPIVKDEPEKIKEALLPLPKPLILSSSMRGLQPVQRITLYILSGRSEPFLPMVWQQGQENRLF
ncbi:hypothetical protein RCG23_12515 [Neobacillus sp. PS3-34]|uniref:molybdopterin-binding protein n=1 Tax=Neobacillus sp. PS3-34 TaxID=3070678 RepID=UPI0027E1267B|nr:molybdopterin-binding protein [Neobacillus sp. PS3-34]WML50452.1 hypothetical protein RCG23_12515 [Neobacillus sp. PS3-34]